MTPGWRSRLLERFCERATAVHLSARKGIPQLRPRALAVYDTRSLFPQTPEARLWTVFVNAFLSIQLRLLCRGHSTCVKTWLRPFQAIASDNFKHRERREHRG